MSGRMNGSRMDGRAMFMERTKQDQVDGLSSLDCPLKSERHGTLNNFEGNIQRRR
jgi:hypothetical protein